MADAPIVENSDGSYSTTEHCSICQKVTPWLKEGDAPWSCTRCGSQAPLMGGMLYCQYCHKETLFRIYSGTIIFCTECAARLNARLATTIPESRRKDMHPATLGDTSVGFCGRCGADGHFDNDPCGNCGAPVWSPWLGADEIPPGKVWIQCPRCQHTDAVPADSQTRVCAACKKALCFGFCKSCGGITQLQSEKATGFRCVPCRPWGSLLPATAGEYFVAAITSASWVPIIDPDMRWLNECVVLAAAGVSFSAGAICVLRFDANGLGMLQPAQKRVTFWPYSEVHALELGGPGMVQTQTGGGFIGGGFGIAGAAGGMLAAAALNALTKRKKTSITTLIVLKTTTSEVVFLNQRVPPERLQLDLTPAFLRLRLAHAAVAESPPLAQMPSAPANPVARLRELAALVKDGILTDQEFQEAKKRILEKIG